MAAMSTSGCSEKEQSMRKRCPQGLCRAMCAGLVIAIRNQAMRYKRLVKVDRLSFFQGQNNKGNHTVEDKALSRRLGDG